MLHACEIRPRKDHSGVDLISDALLFGRLWYEDANAAVDYAKHSSRSHDAVIRVYDEGGNVIETREHGNPTEARSFGAMFLFPIFSPLRVGSAPFPLFPRVILPPVLNRAYSAPATLFNLIHKIKITDRADQTVMKADQSASNFSVADWIEEPKR